jgi:acetyltransferase-like isoleucine patch superfamily enzyme
MKSKLKQFLFNSFSFLLSPLIIHTLMRTPQIWGNKSRLKVAKTSSLNNTVVNLVSGDVIIGENVFFGHSCMIITGTHDYYKFGLERKNFFPKRGRNIIIENGVWIGSGAIILGPCFIGRDSVIGAGALVLSGSNIPEKSIVVGVPGKIVKKIKKNEIN